MFIFSMEDNLINTSKFKKEVFMLFAVMKEKLSLVGILTTLLKFGTKITSSNPHKKFL